jgi:hypothetical protein
MLKPFQAIGSLLLLCFTVPLLAQSSSSRLDCVAGLSPDISVLIHNDTFRLIYLRTLTREQYDGAKSHFGGQYADLFGANYDEYRARRDHYFDQQYLNIDLATSTQEYVQSVPAAARLAYFRCVERLSNTFGLWVTIVNEDAAAATAHVRYNNGPGSPSLQVYAEIAGSNSAWPHGGILLPVNGTRDITLSRASAGATIRITVHGPNGSGFSDAAVSFPPRAPVPAKTVPTIVWEAKPMAHDFTCWANGRQVGKIDDCHPFNTCGFPEGNRRMCIGRYYKKAIEDIMPGVQVPVISWSYTSPKTGHDLECYANGKKVGYIPDCHPPYNTCGSIEGDTLLCAGMFYEEAVQKEWDAQTGR